MKSVDYNKFHVKSKNIQYYVISDRDFTYQSIISVIGKHFKLPGNILDVGCGVGTIDFYLASKGFSVDGIDISSKAIDLARKSAKDMNISQVKFYVADLSNKWNVTKLYKYIICSEVIEHIPDDVNVLRNIYKVISPKGLLVLSCPSKNAPLFRWHYLNEFDRNVGHLRRYTKNELCTLVEGAGFKIREVFVTEGLLRNSLYTINILGNFVRFIRWPITPIFNILDKLTLKIFGESDIYIVACKEE